MMRLLEITNYNLPAVSCCHDKVLPLGVLANQ